ncbi:MAG: 3-phosphoshikimate 1-carboxyvinyltransferase [Chloroflexi bacterium]|nr:3-phosphoshikimate 1-carboxyvinyltransferase [Chloroflexota bacterium]MYK61375.1 3-phosphoshikimate 1-carboxyvinyltransferase [Chloroflexota bacterium]
MDLTVSGPRRLAGEIVAPGDKSVSHRAVMLNSIAEGQATITNFSPGDDCTSTMVIMRALGVNIERASADDGSGDTLVVKGAGTNGLREAEDVLDAGNSGTTMRLMSGILAGREFKATMTGDSSLQSRPMGRIIKPLSMMGAVIRGRENNTLAPLEFDGGDLSGIEYDLPVASAQLKSAILLAGLRAEGKTSISQPAASRDHTERMLSAMGADIRVDGLDVTVGQSEINCVDVDVPGDISSAAFWIVAGLIHPNSEVVIKNVGINPTRAGVITALQDMGGNIELVNERDVAGEPVADIVATSSNLRGTELAGSIMPLLMDEVPVIAVAAAMAEEETVIRDAAELRVKETDRISATVDWLVAAGVEAEARDDGMAIVGSGRIAGGTFQSQDDHRIAMALGIAAMVSDDPITVVDAGCASISYPEFWDELESLGGIVD